MPFRPWLAGILVALAASSLSAADGKYNVLFIISDDLSAQSLSCYGHRECQSPNIDALAKRGVKFTRTYCQYPVCGPSRAALMSGLHTSTIGVMNNRQSHNFTKNLGDRASMSQHFRNHGYYAARVSKIYHMRIPGDITAGVDGDDHAASWDERFNCQAPEWHSAGEAAVYSNEKLKKDPSKHYGLGFGTAFYAVKTSTDGSEQADHQAADKAIELLRDHQDERFFLAVGMVRPHVPLVAPAKFFAPYPAEKMKLPAKIDGDWSDIPKAGISRNSKATGMTRDDQQQTLTAYFASVAYMDHQVGRILDELKRLGLDKNTIVVFTADHGYHLGEHDFWQKMSLHEESTHIPLIIAIPGQQPKVVDALAGQIDIYPTLADLCGLEVPDYLQGVSQTAAINTPGATAREEIMCEMNKGKLLRTDRYAYIQYKDGSEELYDMQTDPHQYTNLAQDLASQDDLVKLRQQLKQQTK
ncbi:sulfatase [Blastopirellula retiformator]|uniref:Choline-sulfatase n=1 Tax=Blastopirellula retiformator TaxID=2527970 RepID=A0A5C5VLY9_9BACT|nr:sulfatase [Blastopirellula retiformator]TWT39093.1 Choline-sulfatase [Blastopirellula retiformator]